MTTPKEFLGGGGGAPTAKFPEIGATVGGVIKSPPQVTQQTDIDGEKLFWPDGNERQQLEVTVLTDERDDEIENDDGSRRIFVKGYMKNAVGDAVRDAGADDLEVGGSLFVTFINTQPAKQRGYSPAKLYSATYTRPTVSASGAPSATRFGEDEEPF